MNNKFLLLPFLLFLAFGLVGCDDEDDAMPIDLNLFAGTWEVVASDTERNCIYEITMSPNKTEGDYGGAYGTITTYYLTVTGNPIYDRQYNWSIRYMEDYRPLLDLTLEGELDSEEPCTGKFYYKIIKLNNTHMWWRGNSNGDNNIIKFRRRTDLENK